MQVSYLRCFSGAVIASVMIVAIFMVYVENNNTSFFFTTILIDSSKDRSRSIHTADDPTTRHLIDIITNDTVIPPDVLEAGAIVSESVESTKTEVAKSTRTSRTTTAKQLNESTATVAPADAARHTTVTSSPLNLTYNSSDEELSLLPTSESELLDDTATTTKAPKHFNRPRGWDLRGYARVPLYLNETLDIHCSSCAMVSSSGQLIGSNAGQEIDNTPCVIRMNDAPVQYHEADVGIRTTIRLVAHSSAVKVSRVFRDELFNGTEVPEHVIFWGPGSAINPNDGPVYKSATWLHWDFVDKGIKFYVMTNRQMGFSDREFEKWTHKSRDKSGSWLSTGFFALILARQICDDIHIYGMINDEYCLDPENQKKNTTYHYYTRGDTKAYKRFECQFYNSMEYSNQYGKHRFISEKNVFAKWAQLEPKITFHQPSWEPAKNSTFKMWWDREDYADPTKKKKKKSS